jgi:hypothetical protein
LAHHIARHVTLSAGGEGRDEVARNQLSTLNPQLSAGLCPRPARTWQPWTRHLQSRRPALAPKGSPGLLPLTPAHAHS